MTIAPGERASSFTLTDENGREVSLPATTAATVLVFYRGDW